MTAKEATISENPLPLPHADILTFRFNTNVILVREDNYPKLFEQVQGNITYTYEYRSKELPERVCFSDQFSLEEAIKLHRAIYLPSKQYITYTPDEAATLSERAKEGYESAFIRNQARQDLTKQTGSTPIQPNLELWRYAETETKNATRALAAQLIREHDTVTSAQELTEYAKEIGYSLPIHFDWIRRAFLDIVNRKDLRQYLQMPGMLLSGYSNAMIYESASHWLAECTLQEIPEMIRIKSQHLPFELDTGTFPELEVIPYLVKSHIEYLSRITEGIKPEQEIRIGVIESGINTFIVGTQHEDHFGPPLIGQILRHHLEQNGNYDRAKIQIQGMEEGFNELKAELLAQVQRLKDNPQLLNKIEKTRVRY